MDFKKTWENIQFEISYFVTSSIIGPFRSFIHGLDNFRRYRKVIWRDRWWDYSFLLELLHFKLTDMEKNWGNNTHYVGDYEDKKILQEIIEDLEWMMDEDNSLAKDYEAEYKKRSRRMFGRLDRHHRKFWD